jgi:hypothetical protein
MISFSFFCSVTLCFILYVEYTIGNVLYRTNSQGTRSLNISSMIHFLVNPLQSSSLWNYHLLDVNYVFIWMYIWGIKSVYTYLILYPM